MDRWRLEINQHFLIRDLKPSIGSRLAVCEIVCEMVPLNDGSLETVNVLECHF